jgi:hypothetical protein
MKRTNNLYNVQVARYAWNAVEADSPKEAMDIAVAKCFDEQNPAVKVEPMFRVGDWIVSNEKLYVYQIEEINEFVVKVREINGETFVVNVNCLKDAHLWSIKDAKDGDVLIDKDINVIGIFEGVEGMCWHSKFYYSNVTKEFYGIEYGGSHQKEFAKPATKEQRDMLFQKMKEAGYEWDAEKKELKLLITNGGDFDEKNCEQKHSININKMVDDYANNKERGNEEFGKPVPCMIRAYRQGLNDAIGKVVLKPAWSEEDEKTLNTTISFLSEYAAIGYENAIMCIDWIKSLKQRIG